MLLRTATRLCDGISFTAVQVPRADIFLNIYFKGAILTRVAEFIGSQFVLFIRLLNTKNPSALTGRFRVSLVIFTSSPQKMVSFAYSIQFMIKKKDDGQYQVQFSILVSFPFFILHIYYIIFFIKNQRKTFLSRLI